MRLCERPGVADHLLEGLCRRPAELGFDPVAGGDEHGRVAGSTRCLARDYMSAGHLTCGLDDLPYREAVPIAEVEHLMLARPDRLERQQVGDAQVLDVDVVPHRGSV